MTRRHLTGWGGAPTAVTEVVTPDKSGLPGALTRARNGRGLIPRGLGRSYGDAAQRSGGTTLIVNTEDSLRWIDESAGTLHCPGDVSLADVIRFIQPSGYFVPVTPGTKHVSIGGAIAMDVHGKNHHIVGSFGSHVGSLELLLADGSVCHVNRDSNRQLFDATIGGLGLTGIILSATLRTSAVPGSSIRVETTRTTSLGETCDVLAASDSAYEYTVAWVDLMSRGERFGRGVVSSGNHHDAETAAIRKQVVLSVPARWNMRLVNRATVAALNEAWYRKAPTRPRDSIESYDSFFYPLDGVGGWNRVYGKRGFLQYQFAADVDVAGLQEISRLLASCGVPISLAVLKRFGPRGTGTLSFPIEGWTVAVDIPIPRDGADLEACLQRVDQRVSEVGGRVYFAKDSRLSPEMAEKMYPELADFRRVRDEYDPDRVFQSDLSERLRI